ncbi:MAG: UDP-2,4-diacetamido-2,4,6-trideoxy-beta-L-altropyranose hydrolase [Terasakiella sp.]|uniref:UDP-2,4-diacetamido-2,4, 6-trideoxy-beta-L-altropyranose hydrolase n=1 Tax=unclassified Terasakiella TaxID=2614952 RepID=UPI003B00C037
MKKPNCKVALRFNASVELGGGHAVRCFALLNGLSNELGLIEAVLFTNEDALDVIKPFLPGFVKIVTFPERVRSVRDEVHFMVEQLDDACDLLIVDHYGLDADFETEARKWARRIFVFDDLHNRSHDCDYLLDQTFGCDAAVYEALNQCRTARYFCGSKWALLREPFTRWREKSLNRRLKEAPISHVLISAGATDPVNLSGVYLNVLRCMEFSGRISLVLGGQAPYRMDLEDKAQKMDMDVSFLSDVQDMERLLYEADFVMGAAGSSALERCVLGVPSAIAVIADNQVEICQSLGDAGAALNLGELSHLQEEKVAQRLLNLFKDPQALRLMSEKAASVCDGHGLRHVCKIVVSELVA